MDVLAWIGWVVLLALGYMTLVWVLSLVVRNASIVDSFWELGFVVIAVCALFLVGSTAWRNLLVPAPVAIWSARLATNGTARSWRNGEAWRHRTWREGSNKASSTASPATPTTYPEPIRSSRGRRAAARRIQWRTGACFA